MSDTATDLPTDFEEIQNTFLFTDEEITRIVARRNEFKNRVEKQHRSVRDFLKFITFESEILKNTTEKSGKTILINVPKTKEFEEAQKKRIIDIYERVIGIFPHESKLYENLINFCIKINNTKNVPLYFVKWIHYYGDGPEVWFKLQRWINNEFNNISQMTDTTNILYKTEPETLYKNVFKMELAEMAKLSNNRVEAPLSLQCAEDIYDNSKREIKTVEYLIDLLTISEDYIFTKPLQNVIIKDMTKLYPDHHLTWNALALRELKGFHLVNFQVTEHDFPDIKYIPEKLRFNKRMRYCTRVFEYATKIIRTSPMWSLYIDAMIELNKDQTTQPILKRKLLMGAYRSANMRMFLNEQHYLQYIDLLMDEDDLRDHFLLNLLNQATGKYPESIGLWKIFMRHCILEYCRDTVYEIFYRALENIKGSNSIPLWQIIIQYSLSEFELGLDKIEEVYKEVIQQPEPVGSHFKADYIEWTALNRGIISAHNTFKEINKSKPYSYNMHKKMLKLNLSLCRVRRGKNNTNDEVVIGTRYCLDLSRKLFGHCKPEVWIDSIKFVRDYGDTKEINVLFQQAKEILQDDLIDKFLTQYDLIKPGYD